MTLIKARRSIKPKDFSKEPITKQEIMTLLEAANWAPSHGKTESWRFTVVHGERALKELVDVTCGIFRSLGNKEKEEYVRKEFTTGKFKQIQCIIFIGMKRKSIPDKTMPEWYVSTRVYVWDVCIRACVYSVLHDYTRKVLTIPNDREEICSVASAVQNMQLAGTASGIHGYWSSWFDGALEHANTAKYLGLDFKAGDKCLGCLLLGKATPDRVAGYRGSKRPVETKVTFK